MNVETVDAILVTLAVVGLPILILLIWNIVLSSKLRRMKRRYQAMMGDTGVQDLESVIRELQRRTAEVEQGQGRQAAELERLAAAARGTKGKIGVVRFNAFDGQGSDLSFAVAVINEEQSGVVLSGIHSRDETYVYAKPVDRGDSSYPLTPEERQAITRAVQP